jgi:hypothetical protein
VSGVDVEPPDFLSTPYYPIPGYKRKEEDLYGSNPRSRAIFASEGSVADQRLQPRYSGKMGRPRQGTAIREVWHWSILARALPAQGAFGFHAARLHKISGRRRGLIRSPAEPPATQEAAGAGPRGSIKNEGVRLSSHVRVVNAVWNGSGFIKRKKADRFVKEGRAVFVGTDQLRLIESDPRNLAAAAKAAAGYVAIRRTMTLQELKHLPVMRPRIAYTDRSIHAARQVAGRKGATRIVGNQV